MPHDVHLSEPIGAFNTFVLICSSVTVVLAWRRPRRTRPARPRAGSALTFVLGSVFLGVKAYEYNAKFSHGIYPWKPHSLIHEQPDLYYASAVRDRLADPVVLERSVELKAATRSNAPRTPQLWRICKSVERRRQQEHGR